MTKKMLSRSALLVAMLLVVCSCMDPFRKNAAVIIQTYIDAVQNKDFRTLYDLSVDKRDESVSMTEEERKEHFDSFTGSLEEKYLHYETGRDRGWLDFEADGVVLVKATVLGKGAFYRVENFIKLPGSVAYVDTIIKLGYPYINYSTLPLGTVAYLLGYPIGKIERLIIQSAGRVTLKVVKEFTIRWWLESRKASNVSPSGWYLKGVEVLPNTVAYETVTWTF
ncbi:MAG: hypothetical protein AB1756_04505 [Acidobacteriota bacterium]